MAVIVDNENAQLVLSDMGVTLRTLLAVAAGAYPDTRRRRWNLSYKGATIGRIQIKDEHLKSAIPVITGNLKGNKDECGARSTEGSRRKRTANEQENLAVAQGSSP